MLSSTTDASASEMCIFRIPVSGFVPIDNAVVIFQVG
jgi:hypothetical protein